MWTLRSPQSLDTAHNGPSERIIDAALTVPRLLRHPVWRPADPDQGSGQGVVLVPGFGFGDRSLTMAHRWLRARGYRPSGAGVGINVGCTTRLVERLERTLDRHADSTGKRVVLIGQSRGGWLARHVAVRRPEVVRAVVMLGSAVLDPLGAHPRLLRLARWLARLSAMGVPGLLDRDCLSGRCYEATSTALITPLPADVPALSIYSRHDRIAPWRLCLDPSAECVEVRSSHTGMGLDPDFYAALEPRLTGWTASP